MRTSGAVECWGWPADAPEGSFSAVSAGGWHTCGLRTSGAVECWGANYVGQTDAPSGAFSAVSAGRVHTCGLRPSGAVACWGDNEHGQADAPGGSFSAVSAGGWPDEVDVEGRSHTCGLRVSGVVECWGDNNFGQADAPGGLFSAVSAGGWHTCGLRMSGAVECWGGNNPADVPARLRGESGTATEAIEAERGRIVARRTSGGRTEFGWLPAGAEERVLPSGRYFPANAEVGRWLRSTPVVVNGVDIGRISARRLADGRIEFGFTPTGGERILPSIRYFPAGAAVDRWLRSSEIESAS